MRIRKSLLLSGSVLAIVALLGATNAFATIVPAPLSCTSTLSGGGTGNFVVNAVLGTTPDGLTRYTYSMSSPTGKNANKFFIFTKGRQVDGQGLQGDLTGTIGGVPSGEYLRNGTIGANNCPTSWAWATDKTDDGYCFTSIGMGAVPMLTVSEREDPASHGTTILLGLSNTTEGCGPIVGPTGPVPATIEGNNITSKTTNIVVDGCTYILTSGGLNNYTTSVALDVAHSPDYCSPVVYSPNDCEICTGLAVCPSVEAGAPMLVVNSCIPSSAGAVIATTCPPAGYPAKIYHHTSYSNPSYPIHSCTTSP